MSLSQHEQMILKGIEDDLAQQDPQLCAWLAGTSGVKQPHPHRLRWVVLAAALGLVLGITLAILGKLAATPTVTRAGLATALLASVIWIHLAGTRLAHRRHTC